MGRFCNIAIAILFSLVLVGPALVFACERAHVNFPSWATAEDAKWLVGNVKDGKVKENLNLDGLVSNRLQAAVTTEVDNHVPFKAGVLLANAGIQRVVIGLANAPFGWGCYPTFFGSDRCYCPKANAIYETPVKVEEYSIDELSKKLSHISEAIENREDINWYFALPDRSSISLASPLREKVSRAMDYNCAVNMILGALPSRISKIDLSCKSLMEYQNKYFRTDHHMQIQGAVDFYQKTIAKLGKKPCDFNRFYQAYNQPIYGSNARIGLYKLAVDYIYDVDYDRSNLSVMFDNKKVGLSALDASWRTDSEEDLELVDFQDAYIIYFQSSPGLVTITNDDADENAGALLLISDSYDNSSARFFAENYKVVYELDPRHYEGDINEFVSSHSEITDAVMVFCLENIYEFR